MSSQSVLKDRVKRSREPEESAESMSGRASYRRVIVRNAGEEARGRRNENNRLREAKSVDWRSILNNSSETHARLGMSSNARSPPPPPPKRVPRLAPYVL